MSESGRVVTVNLPKDLFDELDKVVAKIDRTKSWIVRQAVSEWLAEWHRRHQLTLEALNGVAEGRVIPHEEILAWTAQKLSRPA